VRLPDGTEAVLKIAHDLDAESVHEPEALAFWDGDGTVRLIAHDPATRAMLIERCVPGTPLGTKYDEPALEIAAQAMERLWRPPSDAVPWRRIEDVAADWQAADILRELLPTEGGRVLCHQDLHGGNILRAEREPWLVIDSKPIVAEREYDAVALIRDAEPTVPQLRYRLDFLSERLELDRERVRLWGIAKCLAWDRPQEAELFSAVGSS
jgi:streptomycin 6-kinase